VPAGAIVLTKADAADAETLELARMESRELVAGSFLEGAPIVSVSSKTGEGLDDLRAVLRELAARVTPRNAVGSARLPVDRVFTLRGFGTVVTGTLVSGTLREGQTLSVLPRGLTATARGVQVHGKSQASASAGHRVAVNVGGVELADLERGATLCEPGSLEPTSRFDASIELLAESKPLRHGARVRFHQGTSEIMGRVALSALRGSSEAATELQPGRTGFARLRLERPAVITRGDRFILRAYSPPITIGGGIVLDPHPPRTAIRTAAGIARFGHMDVQSPIDTVLLALVEERGAEGLTRDAVCSRAGLAPAAAEQAIGRLTAGGRVVAIGDVLVSRRLLDDTAVRLLEVLKTHHAANPISDGMHREEARARLMPRALPAVFEAAIAPLVADGRVSGRDRLSLAGHTVSLSGEEARARDRLLQVYFDAGLAPPDAAAARTSAGADAAIADRMTALLLRQRRLIKVDTLLFHADRLEELKADIRALKTSSPSARVDVASFKERYGISRKFAIPLLEYLDRERLTRRVGESRVLV
jgi:selenocysteine-specific elongation factor